jgi:hypothetical protein
MAANAAVVKIPDHKARIVDIQSCPINKD